MQNDISWADAGDNLRSISSRRTVYFDVSVNDGLWEKEKFKAQSVCGNRIKGLAIQY